MMIEGRAIKTYFSYNWWKFLLIALALIIVWSIAINEIVQPRENEKIIISAVNISLEKDRIELDGMKMMEDYLYQDIEIIYVETIELEGPELHEFLSTRALPGTDLIFLPESDVLGNTASSLFLPLDEQAVIDYFGEDIKYYYEDGILYGIGLTQDTYQTVFSSYLRRSSTEDYYVFINSYSKNVGDWNEDGIANEKAALEFIHWLISDRTTE